MSTSSEEMVVASGYSRARLGLLTQFPLQLLPHNPALRQALKVTPRVLLLVKCLWGLCPEATQVRFDSVYPSSSD